MRRAFDFNELKLTDRLPSPSGTALAIIKLTQNENVDIKDITHIIQTDPALTGKILRMANSAAVGAKRPILDVHSAAVLMGTKVIRNLALSFSIIANHKQGRCKNFNYSMFWSMSLAKAVALHNITELNRLIIPEEGFTVGLLSDIGVLAMATVWPEEYNNCLVQAPEETTLIELEKERFSVDHNSLGIMILEDWGFPKFILESIEYSRYPSDTGNERIKSFGIDIRFANEIAETLMNDFLDNNQNLSETFKSRVAKYELSQTDFEQFMENTNNHWKEWGKQLEINLSQPKRRASDFHKTSIPLFTDPPKPHHLKLLLINTSSELKSKLAGTGFLVEACQNYECAMQSVIDIKPGIVIFDTSLVSHEDIEFCKALRSFEHGKACYVVMITDCVEELSLIGAFNAGIDDFIVKPVNFRLLLARMRAGERILALQNGLTQKFEELEQSRTALAIANKQLLLQANSDSLTGLPNRRYAQNQLEQLCTPISATDSVGILILDLDYFKSINDNLGHDAGDKVLIHTAKLIRETVRFNDIACRWGGEEFLIIIVDRDPDIPMLMAERIRATIEANQCPGLDLPKNLTVSIGVSVCGKDKQSSWKYLLNKADTALYQAKQQGRNTIKIIQ